MFTEARYNTLVCRSRRARNARLNGALKHIGFSNRYQGASISNTINFDETYNRPDQIRIYGKRSKQDVARMSETELAAAKNDFSKACDNCEFRHVAGKCQDGTNEAVVFSTLLEDADIRKRFAARLQNEEVEKGYKSTPCLKLLQKPRLKNDDWSIY